MTICVYYNKKISAITKENGKYIRHLKNGTSEEITIRDVVYDLAGMYAHFLSRDGKNPLAFDTASNPLSVLDTILTDDGTKNGTPLLDEDFTADILTSVMQGIDTYCNKKCKNYEVAYGIGQFMYKVYQPYEFKPSERIQKLFATFIITGTFIMQMKRKPLARSMYLGIYNAWEWSKNYQKRVFQLQHVKDTCDNLLECTDVFDDPIHDMSQAPQNFRKYSIDNLILIVCIATRIIYTHEKNSFLKESDEREYRSKQEVCIDIIRDEFKYYDMRCQYFLASDEEKDKIRNDTDIEGAYQLRKGYSFDIFTEVTYEYAKKSPYIWYTRKLIASLENKRCGSKAIAEAITKTKADKLDLDCPVCGEYFTDKHFEDLRVQSSIKGFVIGLIAIGVAALVYRYMYVHPIRTAVIEFFLVIFAILGIKGDDGKTLGESVADSSGGLKYGINLNTGESGLWWII